MTKLCDVVSRMTRRHWQRPLAASYALLPTECADGEDAVAGGVQVAGQSKRAELRACLSTLDLVSLGVGSCLGTGVYLTAGLVASTMAGPAGVLSLLIAGAASIFSGLCYAELAGLCPKTSGSAYMYTYITVGELAAFVIGWGLIVEYVIGAAAGAVALSETLDSLVNGHVTSVLGQVAAEIGLHRLDLVAAAICLLLTLLLASGVEMSARVNNIFNAVNMVVVVFFVIASLFLGSVSNWTSSGFLPLGLTGVLHAIPTSYFAYIGFDTVATTGEEAKNPETSIPRSILLSVVINCLVYVTVVACLTYALPYHLLHHDTALTDVFPQLQFAAGKYLTAVGAACGLFAATFGSLFPLPRVLSAMAADGLIFRSLGKICPKRRTPLRATFVSGVVAMVMATFVYLNVLIELVLMGTLLAYILVAFAVLLTRYVGVDSMEPRWRDSVCGSNTSGLAQTKSEAITETNTGRHGATLADLHADDGASSGPCCRNGEAGFSERAVGGTRARAVKTRARDCRTRWKACTGLPTSASSSSQTHDHTSSSSSEELEESDATSLLVKIGSDVTSCTSAMRRISASSAETGSLGEEWDEQPVQGASGSRTLLQNEKESRSGGMGRGGVCSRMLNVVCECADVIAASRKRTLTLLATTYGLEIALSLLASAVWDNMADKGGVVLGAVGLLSAMLMAVVGLMCFMPQTPKRESFRAPCVPALPVIVSLVNIFFITSLSAVTWLLFALWMMFGLAIYLLYGVRYGGVDDLAHSGVATAGLQDTEDAAASKPPVQVVSAVGSTD